MMLAKLFGLAYITVGLGMMINPRYYRESLPRMMEEKGILYFGGVSALIIGYLIVDSHQVWRGWPVLITILGWAALVKGVLLLVAPDWMHLFTAKVFKSMKNMTPFGVGIFIFGLILSYWGYMG